MSEVKKARLNLMVDLLSGLSFVALVSTGFLLQWKLPPGSGRVAGTEGPDRPLTLLWGWDRHEWGEIHFIIGLVFLGLLSLHVGLHWRWLAAMLKGKKREREPRALVGLLGLLLLVASLLPLWGRTEVKTRGEVKRARGQAVAVTESSPQPEGPSLESEELYRSNCQDCHGHPGELPPLDLTWTVERLRQTSPARPHQKLSEQELERVLNYARAAQLSR